MNILTKWLRALYEDCNFRVKYNTVDKDFYQEKWEYLNTTINPSTSPEFTVVGVDLGEMRSELESNYIEISIENAGCRQPHDYLLSGVYKIGEKVILTFSSEFTNWPVSRLVIINNKDEVIRNDFKTVYQLSWKDFKEDKYQPKKKVN